MSYLNAKASTITEIIVFLAVIVVLLICVLWLFENFSYQRPYFEKIDSDLAVMQQLINEACNAYSYNKSVNPTISEGILEVKTNEICITSKELNRCRALICDINSYKRLDLGQIKLVWIKKAGETGVIDINAQ